MRRFITPAKLVFFLISLFTISSSFGQVSITAPATPLTQDFNTLAISGTTNAWTNNITIPGWYSNRTTYIGDAGSSTTGALYSYGSAATSERALGLLSSSTTIFQFAIRLVNNSGSTLSGLTISYRGEQWRQTANSQTLVFESQVGATSISTGTWVPNTGLNFTGPKIGTAGALDGNASGNFTAISGTVTATVSIGQEIWLRWTKTGTTSPGLSIDDFSVTANAAISNNADLSNLIISSGSLSPGFTSAGIAYTASVANATAAITVTPTAADNNSTITVNGATVASGSASASIPLNVGSNTITVTVTAQDGTTIKTYTITVTRAAAGSPIITSSVLADFGNVCINTVAGPNSFILEGSDLDGSNIIIGALSGYTYAETAGGLYNSTLSFSYTGAAFSGKMIYVKFSPVAVQSYNGNIQVTGGGINPVNVAATGAGIATIPGVITSGSSNVAATSATVSGTIAAGGCGTITNYGFFYSTFNGFPNGQGTLITSNNLSGGSFSAALTGLTPNTRYYYKAYATTGTDTSYGAQQAFTNIPSPVVLSAQPGFSFTETFSDIANWGNFFAGGMGAQHFSNVPVNATGSIPNPTVITGNGVFVSVSSTGIQKGTIQIPALQSIVLLSTGGTDNTSSTALDFYMDFTGLNAGNLSFDYETLNNSAGNRAGSLRVYATVDGLTFTELSFASVLNFINNIPIFGSKTNIALPAIFNNIATARLRFYYHNGSGGTTGSRPKISIDNLTVTAVSTTPCTAPAAAATNLTFGTITDVSIQGSFTAANPASDNYLVIISNNSTLTGNPVNGQTYAVGDNVGDGTVIFKGSGTSFTATGLSASTNYYFFIFPFNGICTGGPLYYTTTVLSGNTATIAGLPPCAAPASQPTSLVFGTTTTNSAQGSFTGTTSDSYLVLRSTSSTLSSAPVTGQTYTSGDVLGNATVVQSSTATSFTANNLAANTQYYFFIFSFNSQNCVNGPAYNTLAPLSGSQTTMPLPPCVAPGAQPSNLLLTASNSAISGTFTSVVNADTYLVILSTSPTLSALPANNTDYTAGQSIGGGTVVASAGITSFLTNNLIGNTSYYFYIYAANKNCAGGTKYNTVSPLTGNVVTTAALPYNYYFGTLHSHSDYSDGNKDNPGFTPSQNYAYAMTAQCMDYLGISEHNHFSSPDNPGNLRSTYLLGTQQATTFTTNNPNFLALYGMEWGVISNGGHVLIYGNGLDQLFGWETGSGVWGPTSNYDVFVPKSVYTGPTGLFKTVNDYIAQTNSFATLAHPNLSDYNNIAGTATAYNAVADTAIVGCAIESGPANSTNTTYSDPSLFNNENYLFYFRTLLSKGYHLGPIIDHDNHYTTFGKTTYSRTAIISRNLSKDSIIKGMRDMHFYATQDCDSKLNFTVNTGIMGTTLTDRFGPNISVTLTDATTSTSAAVIRLMFGIPGSGSLAVKIDSVIGNSMSYNDAALPNLATGYYYIDVINGSARVISSPIWYTRNDNSSVVPVTLSSFNVKKVNESAKITWTTDQEINSKNFAVEHSADGTSWVVIATINAAGHSSTRLEYVAFHNAPVTGFNYYRLRQNDNDGSFKYSEIRSLFFSKNYEVRITPNPATTHVNVYISKKLSQKTLITLMDSNGRIIETFHTTEQVKMISTAGLAKGVYIIKTITENNVDTGRIIVQ